MNRSLFTTTIDTELLKVFRSLCKSNGENMNTILEVFMRAYINGDIEIERVAKYKANSK